MKKVIFTLLAGAFMVSAANAQYCGNTGSPSGPGACTPSGTLTEPGLSPNSNDLPPVVNGTDANTTIQFKNFNQFNYNGVLITIQSLRIDSIGNLPAGTCWKTNKTDNTFANQEDGCIQVNGVVCADPGQYKLRIFVTANTNIGVIGPNLDAETVNLKYFVRVKNSGDADVAVDTNQTQLFVKHAGYAAASVGCTPGTGINEVAAINAVSVVPNPFTNKAVVSFVSEKSTVMTERLSNMLGAVVYKNTMNVKAGENSSVLDATNLPAGVYFYSITDGKQTTTKRVVVSE